MELPPRGVKGAAAAAWDDMADTLTGAERIEGVKAGESKFSDFFLFIVSSTFMVVIRFSRSLGNKAEDCANRDPASTG